MNIRVIALFLIAVIASSVGAGAYFLSLSGSESNSVQNYVVDNPNPSSNDLTNTTINAVNSTIIAGENTTIINPNITSLPTSRPTPTSPPTATPHFTLTPTPVPTPIPYDFTVTYHEIERNATTVTLSITFANGNGQKVNAGDFYLSYEGRITLRVLNQTVQDQYKYMSDMRVFTVSDEPYTTTIVLQLNYDFTLTPDTNYKLAMAFTTYNIEFIKI
jgi:hypothetical protein